MRLAIVAVSSALAFIAGAWWLGRDAARPPAGASTTVELATPDGEAARDEAPRASVEAGGPAEPDPDAASARAGVDAPAEIPEQWIPTEAPFAEAALDEARAPSVADVPSAPRVPRDATSDANDGVRVAVDQEAWANRIRRMLEVYRRVGPVP